MAAGTRVLVMAAGTRVLRTTPAAAGGDPSPTGRTTPAACRAVPSPTALSQASFLATLS